MELSQRIKGLTGLGKYLNHINKDDLDELIHVVRGRNSWFNEESILLSLEGLKQLLREQIILEFVKKYDFSDCKDKKIGIVMAGNIPAVGFHDLLLVLLTGSSAIVKLSQQDDVLMKFVINILLDIESEFKIEIVEKMSLDSLDGVIATGSDNTSRYFESYFSRIPNIIRKNRVSVAVLNGLETAKEIESLGSDIFQYFGLGCRNVSKIYVPYGFDFPKMLDNLMCFENITQQHKYDNNYTYHKSVYLINGRKHYDTGFLLITEDKLIHSPLSVLYYEYYDDTKTLFNTLESIKDKLQCVATNILKDNKMVVPIGQTQYPSIEDFADGVDVVKFILSLN